MAEDRANGTVLQRNSTEPGDNLGATTRGRSLAGRNFGDWATIRAKNSAPRSPPWRRTATASGLRFANVPSEGSAARRSGARRQGVQDAGGRGRRSATKEPAPISLPPGLRVGGGRGCSMAYSDSRCHSGYRRDSSWAEEHVHRRSAILQPKRGSSSGAALARRGSAYRSFRAPTLNELYREFRVGNAVTQANPLLQPETLFGGEVGADLVLATPLPASRYFATRSTS